MYNLFLTKKKINSIQKQSEKITNFHTENLLGFLFKFSLIT